MNYARGDKAFVSLASPDWGYTKICTCGKAHGFVYSLIGKPREVEIEKCGNCPAPPKRAVKTWTGRSR